MVYLTLSPIVDRTKQGPRLSGGHCIDVETGSV